MLFDHYCIMKQFKIRLVYFFLILITFSCMRNKQEEKATAKIIPFSIIKNKAFTIGPELDSMQMRIMAECDCCTSDLVLLDDTAFVLSAYCLEADEYFCGSYAVEENNLELIFKPSILIVEYSVGDTTLSEKEYKVEYKKTEPMKVALSEFKGRILLDFGGEAGIEVNDKERIKLIRSFKEDSIVYRLGLKL